MSSISLQNVTKVYPNGVKAVDELSLEIADGELMVLVGPSGCGKTTLMRMIAGLERVTDGRVLIGDQDMTTAAPKERDVAMVFQNYALYPHMTIGENIGFPLRLRRVSRSEIARRRSPRRRGSSGCRRRSTAARASSPAASVSGSRWAARSCASRPCS